MPLPNKEFTSDEFTQALFEGLKGFQEKLGPVQSAAITAGQKPVAPIIQVDEVIHNRIEHKTIEEIPSGKAILDPTVGDDPTMIFEAAVAGATASVVIDAVYTVP